MKALKDLGLDVTKGSVTTESAVMKTEFFIMRMSVPSFFVGAHLFYNKLHNTYNGQQHCQIQICQTVNSCKSTVKMYKTTYSVMKLDFYVCVYILYMITPSEKYFTCDFL